MHFQFGFPKIDLFFNFCNFPSNMRHFFCEKISVCENLIQSFQISKNTRGFTKKIVKIIKFWCKMFPRTRVIRDLLDASITTDNELHIMSALSIPYTVLPKPTNHTQYLHCVIQPITGQKNRETRADRQMSYKLYRVIDTNVIQKITKQRIGNP